MRTVGALRACGIKIEQPEPDMLIVHGKKRLLTPPPGPIDCGNSATTMRLLTGLLAGQPFDSRLVGEATLSKRPMERVITPLRLMGAKIVAEGPNDSAPLRITGSNLHGIDYVSPIASAQVKSAVLLAGLFAKGKTTVHEPSPSRNHTELMLNYFLVRTAKDENSGVTIFGDQVPESRDFTIPGDMSSAAFWLIAAGAQPGGHLLVRDCGLNDTRTTLLGVLIRMGAQVREGDRRCGSDRAARDGGDHRCTAERHGHPGQRDPAIDRRAPDPRDRRRARQRHDDDSQRAGTSRQGNRSHRGDRAQSPRDGCAGH
jgi:3-phosphoshikimate 1-carboxyvinyltransferase